MNDFGPKRPMSEDALCVSQDLEKAKRGRPKKKPDYDREKEIEAFLRIGVCSKKIWKMGQKWNIGF